MLNSVIVEHAEGQTRIMIDSLRVFLHVCLFLDSFEFSEYKDICVSYRVCFALLLTVISLFLDDVGKDGVVDGQSI